jgi:hypothetical protein
MANRTERPLHSPGDPQILPASLIGWLGAVAVIAVGLLVAINLGWELPSTNDWSGTRILERLGLVEESGGQTTGPTLGERIINQRDRVADRFQDSTKALGTAKGK